MNRPESDPQLGWTHGRNVRIDYKAPAAAAELLRLVPDDAALVLPACNSEAMQLHLEEIATKIAPGAHPILILDQAGWHGAKDLRVPSNISLLPLPPRAPE